MKTKSGKQECEYFRAHEIAERFPVFGLTTWNRFIAEGRVPSAQVGPRARVIKVSDVVAFLEGKAGK